MTKFDWQEMRRQAVADFLTGDKEAERMFMGIRQDPMTVAECREGHGVFGFLEDDLVNCDFCGASALEVVARL